jgi:outer membrane protein assembly factor BamE (lipoprotein component of BamABCDE complex)
MVQGRFLIVCLFFTVVTLIGCTPNANYRGKHVTKESLQTLQLGVHTKPDVRSILGSPSSIYTFDQNRWLYISKETTRRAFLNPVTCDAQVIVIAFNKDGIINTISNQDINASRLIKAVDRATPTAGHNIGFFEQIFGNFGRFHRRSDYTSTK